MLYPVKKLIKTVLLNYVHKKDLKKRQRHKRYGALSETLWDLECNEQGHLGVQGIDLQEMAEQYGTPLHVVNYDRLKTNYTKFIGAFQKHYPKVTIGLSYKTNPVPGVLAVLHELGANAEVISHFELWLALKLGVSADSIIFNGPAKTYDSLELAVSRNIKLINIDSFDEIDILESLTAKHKIDQDVAVRVITSVGWSSQFGINIASGEAFQAFQRLVNAQHLNPCAIHIHLGTGIKELDIYVQAIKEVLELAQRLKNELGITIKYLDFGGGFGVPTVYEMSEMDEKLILNGYPPLMVTPDSNPSIESYAAAVMQEVTKYYDPDADNAPEIIFEPGRAMMSSAQCLLLKILTIKQADTESPMVIMNGGKNITMPLGYEIHEVFPVTKMRHSLYSGWYRLFGPLCHPNDILFKYKKLPKLDKGDVLAIMDSGAYFIPNQMNFSNPRAQVIMLKDSKVTVLRKPEQFENIIENDLFD